jgi:signal transduction histidine kinase/HAMP domain-containing protein
MFSLIRRDLGLQLLALYLLFFGPVVLTALVFDRLASQRIEADVKAADLALARAIAFETSTMIEQSLQAIRQLGSYPEVISADKEGMEDLFRTVLSIRPDVNLVYRLDPEGTMSYHYPPAPGSTVGWDFSARDYFQRALTSRNPLFSVGRISPTTQQPVATAVMPLWSPQGEFLGLVATNIKLQSLSYTLASIAKHHNKEESFQVMILDSSGQIIAHPNPTRILAEFPEDHIPIVQSVLSGASGSLISNGRDGRESLYSYIPIAPEGWGVVVSRLTESAFATPRSTHQWAISSVFLYLIVGLIIWFALSRQIIRPLEKLALFSQTVGLEESKREPNRQIVRSLGSRPDQIGHLSSSLSRMEESVDARLRELSTLLETSAAVVSTLESQQVIERILEQVERLMNIKKCALVALDPQQGVFRAKATRGLSPHYSEILIIDPEEPLSVTIRSIRGQTPVQVSDTESDPTFAPFLSRSRSEGYRAVLAVPLITQHAPASALLVYHSEPHVFSEDEIRLLSSFANHAAMAIENAALYSNSDMQLMEQTLRLEALIQSIHDGLILEDLTGAVIYANRRVCELAHLSFSEISYAPVDKVLNRILAQAKDAAITRSNLEDARRGHGQRQVEVQLGVDGQIRHLRLQLFDVNDRRAELIGRGMIIRDVTRSRELDRMKSSLISTVSHELRTPLASIKGYATTLLAEDVEWDRESQREFLEIISGESDRLSKLVDSLLDMSRIEAGNLVVSKEPCNLLEVITKASQRIHPDPRERLQIQIADEVKNITADRQRFEVIMRNLIENAVKYSPEDTPISIHANLAGNTVLIRVEDQGHGITGEHSQRVFESFYRIADGLTRPVPGAGLGLAIAQGFVRAHGGNIWLEPRAVGTCVVIAIPHKDGHQSIQADQPEREVLR